MYNPSFNPTENIYQPSHDTPSAVTETTTLDQGVFFGGSSFQPIDAQYSPLSAVLGPYDGPTSSNFTSTDVCGVSNVEVLNSSAEPIPDPQHLWHWPQHAQFAPISATPAHAYLAADKRLPPTIEEQSYSSPNLHPSSMAVLLYANPYPPIDPLPRHTQSSDAQPSTPAQLREAGATHPPLIARISRDKKHGCLMCHKSFDRPSTLRKHLLVHTGEKAFVCSTCGRRFSVASNLNRHVRRCILKPVNANKRNASPTSPALTSPELSPDAAETSPGGEGHESSRKRVWRSPGSSNSITSGKRARASSSSPSASPASSTSNASNASSTLNNEPMNEALDVRARHPTTTRISIGRRRRRAPSPVNWIPPSLRMFKLHSEAFSACSPLPLPPVRPSPVKAKWTEERDSFDENVGVHPYHPREWIVKPQLPGPGPRTNLGLLRNMMGDPPAFGGFVMGKLVW